MRIFYKTKTIPKASGTYIENCYSCWFGGGGAWETFPFNLNIMRNCEIHAPSIGSTSKECECVNLVYYT